MLTAITRSTASRSIRVGALAVAVATSAVLTAPAIAHAEPAAPDAGPAAPDAGPDATSITQIPGDAELAEFVRTLKRSGGAESAIEALTAILSSDGQLDPTSYLGDSTLLDGLGLDGATLDRLGITAPDPETPDTQTPDPQTPDTQTPEEPGDTPAPDGTAPDALGATDVSAPLRGKAPAAAGDVLSVLQKATGSQLLSPALAPLCVDPSADNPLGLAVAPAVAVPGPWPTAKAGGTDLIDVIGALIPGSSPNLLRAIEDDQTAYALVPPNDPDSDAFRVAWFNTSTLAGGIEDLKPLSEVSGAEPIKALLTATDQFHGIRLAKVKTGEGTVLSAVFGTTTKAGRTCFFLPALGAVEN
ncbi:hypothetical protein [Gordonia shandongensis]|uniref:hypothetical protein n=1 Tax=Gordonia shandongensis TaxID=376351 RepID=UPI0003FC86B2|nr:hypothetical protein [Gordonia shandongensis]